MASSTITKSLASDVASLNESLANTDAKLGGVTIVSVVRVTAGASTTYTTTGGSRIELKGIGSSSSMAFDTFVGVYTNNNSAAIIHVLAPPSSITIAQSTGGVLTVTNGATTDIDVVAFCYRGSITHNT